MCSHENTVLTDDHHNICTLCGVVLGTTFNVANMLSYAERLRDPLFTVYNRNKRFCAMLDSVCTGNESRNDRFMLEHLVSKNVSTRDEVEREMKTANLVDKRYLSVHFFCRCFDKNYIPCPSIILNHFVACRSQIVDMFKHIENEYVSIHGRKSPFFNYRFLLAVLLQSFGLEFFCQFVKPIQCKKRILRNVKSLNELKIKYRGINLGVKDTFRMNHK